MVKLKVAVKNGHEAVNADYSEGNPQAHPPDEETDSEEENSSSDNPEDYDARTDQSVLGPPRREDVLRWGSEIAQFIRSESGLEERWVGRRPLGQGGYGTAGVWEKRDSNGRVIDHIVIKELTGGSDGKWKSKRPKEVRWMKKMTEKNCRGAVHFKTYKRYPHRKRHRIYMEYCPYGDLAAFIERYRRFRAFLPEPFLWEVFYYLMEAAVAMQTVLSPPNEIVHLDIKPQNGQFLLQCFLVRKILWRKECNYPTPKLGDWGITKKTQGLSEGNPRSLVGHGTKPYMAPEQRKDVYYQRLRDREHPWKILSPTNVWAIGLIMAEMMTLQRHDSLYDLVRKNRASIGITTTHRNPEYSKEIRDCMARCLSLDPNDRGAATTLYEIIEKKRDDLHKELFLQAATGQNRPDPKANDRLYYVGNEIQNMPPGDWIPYTDMREKDPESPEGPFQDPEMTPIKFPVFRDANIQKSQDSKTGSKNSHDETGKTSQDNEASNEGPTVLDDLIESDGSPKAAARPSNYYKTADNERDGNGNDDSDDDDSNDDNNDDNAQDDGIPAAGNIEAHLSKRQNPSSRRQLPSIAGLAGSNAQDSQLRDARLKQQAKAVLKEIEGRANDSQLKRGHPKRQAKGASKEVKGAPSRAGVAGSNTQNSQPKSAHSGRQVKAALKAVKSTAEVESPDPIQGAGPGPPAKIVPSKKRKQSVAVPAQAQTAANRKRKRSAAPSPESAQAPAQIAPAQKRKRATAQAPAQIVAPTQKRKRATAQAPAQAQPQDIRRSKRLIERAAAEATIVPAPAPAPQPQPQQPQQPQPAAATAAAALQSRRKNPPRAARPQPGPGVGNTRRGRPAQKRKGEGRGKR